MLPDDAWGTMLDVEATVTMQVDGGWDPLLLKNTDLLGNNWMVLEANSTVGAFLFAAEGERVD